MAWEGEAPAELVSARGSAGASPSQLRVPLTAQDSPGTGVKTKSLQLAELRLFRTTAMNGCAYENDEMLSMLAETF